jgi:hypothetical protein
VKSRHRLGVWADPSGAPSGLDFSGDGRLLAKANASGTVTVLKSLLWNDVAGMQRRLCSVLGRPRTHCAS